MEDLTAQGSANSFIESFSGMTEEYRFYNDEVVLRYQPDEHIYYLLQDGELIAQEGCTTVCHIIDKSNALIPWAAKKVIEKLLKNVPTYTLPAGEIMLGQMTYADFEKIALDSKSAPRDMLEEASDVGKLAHNWLEQYIKAKLNNTPEPLNWPEDERSKNCVFAALDWMKKHNVRWVETEKKVYSRKHQCAGTMDGLALVDSCDDPLCCPHAFKDRLSIIDWKSSNYLYMEYLLQTAFYELSYEEEFDVDVQDRWIIRLGKETGEFEAWHQEEDTFEEDSQAFLTALSLYRYTHSIEDRMKIKKDYIKETKKAQKKAQKEADKVAAKAAKELDKLEKQRQKEEALKLKCKSADKYKGVKYPTCNGNNPCKSCLDKYNQMNPKLFDDSVENTLTNTD